MYSMGHVAVVWNQDWFFTVLLAPFAPQKCVINEQNLICALYSGWGRGAVSVFNKYYSVKVFVVLFAVSTSVGHIPEKFCMQYRKKEYLKWTVSSVYLCICLRTDSFRDAAGYNMKSKHLPSLCLWSPVLCSQLSDWPPLHGLINMSTDDSISEDVSSSGPLSHCHVGGYGDGGKGSETSLVSSEGTSASGLAVSEERHTASKTTGGTVESRPIDITPACDKIRCSNCKHLHYTDIQNMQYNKTVVSLGEQSND